jgi:argininosuccinate synthase
VPIKINEEKYENIVEMMIELNNIGGRHGL